MKRSLSILTLLFTTLFLVLSLGSASAQEPAELKWLNIKLWPEYDQPSLLVIIDGELATPGSDLRIPLPAGAKINALASADSSGRLLTEVPKDEKKPTDETEGEVLFSPQFPSFRVEYYMPLAIDGDKRMVDFEFPAGYLTAKEAAIEVLLPPNSKDVSLDPPADEQEANQNEAHLFQRTVGEVTDQPIRQQVTYTNASGALTVPEAASSTEAPSQPTPPPAEVPPSKTAAMTGNPWILLLGIAAILLIGGGVVGLWLTREKDEEIVPVTDLPPKAKRQRHSAAAADQASPSNLDRYCRNCGKEFGPEDRYCRYCGTKRQTIR